MPLEKEINYELNFYTAEQHFGENLFLPGNPGNPLSPGGPGIEIPGHPGSPLSPFGPISPEYPGGPVSL